MEKEELTSLAESIVDLCKANLIANGEIDYAATMYIADNNNRIVPFAMPFSHEKRGDKERHYRAIALMARVLNAQAVIYEALAWASTRVDGIPSKDPDRRECLVVSAAMKDFKLQLIAYFQRTNGRITFQEREQSNTFESRMTDCIWPDPAYTKKKAVALVHSMIPGMNKMACDLLPRWKGPVGYMMDTTDHISSMRLCRKPSEASMDRLPEFKARVKGSHTHAVIYVQKDRINVPVVKDGTVLSKTNMQSVLVMSLCTAEAAITVLTPYADGPAGFKFMEPVIMDSVEEKLDPVTWED